MFLPSLEPRKYYRKLLFRTRLSYLSGLLITLIVTLVLILLMISFVSQDFATSIGALGEIATGLQTSNEEHAWKGYFLIVIFILVLLAAWRTVGRKRKIFKFIKKEIKSWWGDYPTGATELIKQHFLQLHIAKINLYWGTFFFTGLAFIVAVYSMIAAGGYMLFASGSATGVTQLFKSEFFNNLNTSGWGSMKIIDKVFVIAVLLFIILLIYWIISQYIKLVAIRRVWRVCGENDDDLMEWNNKFVKERAGRANRRNKMITMFILCVLGLIIYIFFKKLIVAIFSKSFQT